MSHGYGIVPEDKNEPVALFGDLEDAKEWGLRKYGQDRFRIRRVTYVESGRAKAN